MNDLISVITVVYNDAQNIEKTIQSVLSQEYDNIEYIIIDGKSNDGTAEICKKYSEKLSLFISEKDSGIYNAMNKGIKFSSGKWIFFLNSGDVFYNTSVISDVFQDNSEADILYGKAITTEGILCYYPKKVSLPMFIFERMICHQAIFAKRETFENNNFNEEYRIIADRVWLYNCYKTHKRFEKKNIIISKYDTNGISSNQSKFDKESLSYLKRLSLLYYLFAKCKRCLMFCKKNY